MSLRSRRLGWILVAISLLLHLFTVYSYARQPDAVAAFTVIPIWLWGGFGLLLSSVAFYFLRASLSLIMSAVWAVTLLVGADEAKVLTNLGKPPPLPGKAEPYEGKPLLRVITMNCAIFVFGNPAPDIAAWEPDIVLLQDVYPDQVRQIADVLYHGLGDYRTHLTNGVVTRWKIQSEIRDPARRNQQIGILLSDGSRIEVVNVHLGSATTNLRLWTKSAWFEHSNNRVLRQHELSLTRQILERTTDFPDTPTIFGGDFNAPASDIVHRQLSRDFVDSFSAAGTGWGDTYQRRFPIIRIDHLYATRHFIPIRCRAVTTRHSDHRMVVTDYLTGPGIKP